MKQKCDHVFYSCVIKLYTNMNKRNVIVLFFDIMNNEYGILDIKLYTNMNNRNVIVLFFDIKNGMNIEFWIENERRQYGH